MKLIRLFDILNQRGYKSHLANTKQRKVDFLMFCNRGLEVGRGYFAVLNSLVEA